MKIKELLNSLLQIIDNGRFLIKPFKWLFLINAILPFIVPIGFVIAIISQCDHLGKAFGDAWTTLVGVIGIIIFEVFLLFAAYFSFIYWINRSKRLERVVKEGDNIVAIPLFAYNIQCNGDFLGLYLGIVPTVGAVLLYIFCLLTGIDNFYKNGEFLLLLLVLAGFAVVMALIGYGIVFLTHYISERMRIFAQMSNDLRDVADIHRAAVITEGETSVPNETESKELDREE